MITYKKQMKIAIFLLCFLFFGLLFIPKAEANEDIDIFGEYAVSIDAKTGEVLYEKNAFEHQGVYPASVTKVLTALLLVENVKEDDVITLSEKCVGQVRSNSQIYFSAGEQLNRNAALYSMMVVSANDIACAIGEHIAGSEEEFGRMMTERAKELGAKNSNFVTASGLHHPEHYTTAYDLALIGKKAQDYEVVMDAMGTKTYEVTTSKQTKELVNPSKIHTDPDALGGKTGYTDAARNTLMKIDEVDGKRVVNIVLRSNLNNIYEDIKKISNYALSQLILEKVVDKEKWNKTLTFLEKTVLVELEDTLILSRNINDEDGYQTEFVQTEKFTKDFLQQEGIKKGMKVGEVVIKKDNEIINKVNVLAVNDVIFERNKQAIIPFALKVMMAILLPLLVYIGFVIFYNQKLHSKRINK